MNLALYPSRVRSNEMLDLNNLHALTILARKAAREAQRIVQRFALVTRREEEPGVIAAVTDNRLIHHVLDARGILAHHPHELHPVFQEFLDQGVYTLWITTERVKNDSWGVRHNNSVEV